MKRTPLSVSLDAQKEFDVSSQGGERRSDSRGVKTRHIDGYAAAAVGHISRIAADIFLIWGPGIHSSALHRLRRPGCGASRLRERVTK